MTATFALPSYMQGMCAALMSQQLLRQKGVGIAGLFSALFGEDITSVDAPLHTLEHVARVLIEAVPPNYPPNVSIQWIGS